MNVKRFFLSVSMITTFSLCIISVLATAVFTYQFTKKKCLDNQQTLQVSFDKTKDALEAQIQATAQVLEEYERVHESDSQGYIKNINSFLDESADKADEISTFLETISNRMHLLNTEVESVNFASSNTMNTSDKGMRHVHDVSDKLTTFMDASEHLKDIQDQFVQVQDKTVDIREIGKEAEMLALNAAIEAARAGEAGRGFAVVADSMKALSRNSQDTTHEIQSIVDASQKKINQIVETYVSQNDELKAGVQELLEKFEEIKGQIQEISNRTATISGEAKSTEDAVEKTEGIVKTIVETQVKELSNLVSMISGVEIINVSTQEAKQKLNSFDEIIDVRRPEEYNDELGHIPQSVLSTLQTDFKQYVKTLDPEKSYLFVCRSGGRSAKAAQVAINHGVKKVFNLDGGMLAW